MMLHSVYCSVWFSVLNALEFMFSFLDFLIVFGRVQFVSVLRVMSLLVECFSVFFGIGFFVITL